MNENCTIEKIFSEIEIEIEIEIVNLNVQPEDKGRTLGCWGPSPDDARNQC